MNKIKLVAQLGLAVIGFLAVRKLSDVQYRSGYRQGYADGLTDQEILNTCNTVDEVAKALKEQGYYVSYKGLTDTFIFLCRAELRCAIFTLPIIEIVMSLILYFFLKRVKED